MSENESTEFTFNYRKELPLDAAAHLWKRWNQLSSWQDWDQSLLGVKAGSDFIAPGQFFSVIPKMTGNPIPVTVVSSVEGLHFTTASNSALGLVAFGHTLISDIKAQTVTLEHSICVVPTDAHLFRTRIWDSLKSDITSSVETLGNLVAKEYSI